MEAFISETGGALGSVSFKLKHRWIAPYYQPDWLPDECSDNLPPLYRQFRGSFLGFPFARKRTRGLPFGETANADWAVSRYDICRIGLKQNPVEASGGEVERLFHLVNDHRALYLEQRFSGFGGRRSVGVMSLLQLPANETVLLSVSPFTFGQVSPHLHCPEESVYSQMKPGARFKNLTQVPAIDGSSIDFSRLPLLRGYDEQVLLHQHSGELLWIAVSMPGYIWLSLRVPDDLPGLFLWHANSGMHGAPWNGELRDMLAVGEVCSYYDQPLRVSRQNPLEADGVPTVLNFSRRKATVLRTIQAVHPVERDFGAVTSIEPVLGEPAVEIRNAKGVSYRVPLHWQFLKQGESVLTR